jgi:hypothetical protein
LRIPNASWLTKRKFLRRLYSSFIGIFDVFVGVFVLP